MQVARIQRPGSRTYGRKLVESLTALFLTLRHGRENVLSHYLRIVPYGNRIHVVDIQTSKVLAWMGSIDYFDEVQSGAIDYASIPRSSGSTLKPFLYGLALDKGVITPASVLDDLPRGSAAITNADKSYLGPMLPRSALSNSRNIPAVDVLEKVGIEEAFDLLGASELHDGRNPARHYRLGLAIGALPVTLEHLVSAYTVFAGDGRYRELVWYRGQPTEEPRQILSEDAARQVTLFLSDPMARLPTFPRMGFNECPFPVAVKTGTSSNYRDAWTVAYSSKFLVGVWVGRADYRPP